MNGDGTKEEEDITKPAHLCHGMISKAIYSLFLMRMAPVFHVNPGLVGEGLSTVESFSEDTRSRGKFQRKLLGLCCQSKGSHIF